jgi:hypothetical protein
MSAVNRTPQDTNFLQPTKFLFQLDRIASAQFFCQSANIPSIGLGKAPINFPGKDIQAPGTKLEYGEFTIRFLVDEKLQSWQDIYNWFLAIASPSGTEQRNTLTQQQNAYKDKPSPYSDGTLTVLSALNNPGLRVNFYNLFPISLSEIQFDTSLSADDTITADATFAFDYFEITSA